MSLNLISPDESDYLHSIANDLLPEVKALNNAQATNGEPTQVLLGSYIKAQLRPLGLSSTDEHLVFLAIEAGLAPRAESNPHETQEATEC